MASRRNLKKKITNIASDLFLVSLMEGVNREVVCNSVHNVIKLIIRISHHLLVLDLGSLVAHSEQWVLQRELRMMLYSSSGWAER